VWCSSHAAQTAGTWLVLRLPFAGPAGAAAVHVSLRATEKGLPPHLLPLRRPQARCYSGLTQRLHCGQQVVVQSA
jgi:hypothetical protein